MPLGRALPILFLAIVGAPLDAGARGVPASNGILNFGKVDDHLFRGAQPGTNGIANLKRLGVTTIISLRTSREAWLPEQSVSAAAGITFTNIPLAGVGRPKEKDIALILSIIGSSHGAVFVHCEHGCDRTGTVIACYRIRHDHWTAAAAQKEANRYGMSGLEFGMKRFIADFAKPATVNINNKKPLPFFAGGVGNSKLN